MTAHQTRAYSRARSPLGGIAAAIMVALVLAGCGPATAPKSAATKAPANQSAPAAGAFPRSIAVPAGAHTDAATVTVDAKPKRVAALTFETAALVAALGAGDRLVMVPQAVTNPVLTQHAGAMAEVETKVASEAKTDVEMVIQSAPDVVLLSARHGLEDRVGKVLADAGIPVLVIPNAWATVEDMLANVALTGKVLGLDAEADTLSAKIDAGLTAATVEPGADAPRVLVLSNQAGRPFVTAGAAFPMELLDLAGAQDAGAALGLTKSGPISAEQVIKANPDAILLIDMSGSGDKLFAPIMNNPAVAALPAIADKRVLMLEGRHTQALGLDGVVEGLDALTEWLDTSR